MTGRSRDTEYDGLRFQVGFEVADLESVRAELIARGVVPVTDIVGDETPVPWAYFRDPEGNVFEIKQQRAGPIRLPPGGHAGTSVIRWVGSGGR